MDRDFILLLFSTHHYPFYQQISYKDLMIEPDVADYLQTNEQRVSKNVLDNIYAYASAAV